MQDFTTDPIVLETALRTASRRRTSKADSQAHDGTATQVQKELVKSIGRTSSDLIKNQHVQPFVAALFAIARESSSIKGRKTVMYFSDGASLGSLNDDQFKAISGEANSSAGELLRPQYRGSQRKSFERRLTPTNGFDWEWENL